MPVYKFRIRTSEAIVSNKYQWLTPLNLSENLNIVSMLVLSKRKISVSQVSVSHGDKRGGHGPSPGGLPTLFNENAPNLIL